MAYRPLLTIAFAVLLADAAWGAEGEWSRFRGPNRSGLSAAATRAGGWGAKHGGEGGGRGGRRKDGPNPAGRSFVVAVDRKSGETRWQTETKTFLAGYSTPCVYQAEGGRAARRF